MITSNFSTGSWPAPGGPATLRPLARTLTTPEAAAVVGVSGQTLLRWARTGLLPAPERVLRGRRGNVSEWPETTIAQARWVFAQLESGKTLDKIRAVLEAGGYPPDAEG